MGIEKAPHSFLGTLSTTLITTPWVCSSFSAVTGSSFTLLDPLPA